MADEYTKESNKLYSRYLNGNLDEAKLSLQDLLRLAESIRSNPFRYADNQFLIYSRLYVLEVKFGNPKTADTYFDQARKWRLESFRAGNMDSSEINQQMKEFTPDRCVEIVTSWDREHHGGKDPAYLRLP